MSKILITGGGFIGSNLVDYFLEKSYKVVVRDNLSTGFTKVAEWYFESLRG